jgi:methyltransferase
MGAIAIAYAIIAAVAIQRLYETSHAAKNTRALLARGALEVGRRHYPLFVLLHGGWLVSIALALPNPPTIHLAPLLLFLLLQAGRIWVIASLGPYWTTRIITLPGAPLVRRGPYRFLRHPNYLIVTGEIATLPLVFGEIWVAIVFTLLNAALLSWRIHVENAVLAARAGQALPPESQPG